MSMRMLLAATALLAPVTAVPTVPGNEELWRQWLRGPPSKDIPLSDARMAAQPGPEQVHITGGSPDSAIVTYTTNTSEPTAVQFRPAGTAEDWVTAEGPPGQVYSMVLDPRYPATELPPGVAAASGGCQGSVNYTNPACFYTSPEIHSVTLSDLKPDTRYEYTCGTSDRTFSFKTPPAVGGTQSIKLAVVGDLGQTHNSSATLDLMEAALVAGDVDLVLHAGDLSYADGNGYRWDAYGRLGEKFWAAVPTAHVGGNHEISNGGENWMGYSLRYPNEHAKSGSDSFLWYSFEAGPVHFILLCSYADTGNLSIQSQWLREDLAKIDRKKTPWVIGMWHTPWYTSNHHHPMSEGATMRAGMEVMMMEAKVDLVFNGHVHAYERTKPVYQLEVNEQQGIPYITIGDGGNREGFATPWNDPQPEWSALRQDAYGYGTLDVTPQTASWTWTRIHDSWNPNPAGVGDSATYSVRKN